MLPVLAALLLLAPASLLLVRLQAADPVAHEPLPTVADVVSRLPRRDWATPVRDGPPDSLKRYTGNLKSEEAA
jgi:hypothetical protein